MVYLKMNGCQILNELNFRDFFSPTDLLSQRELAAGFALQIISPLSLADSFHSYQLYSSVFQPSPAPMTSPEDYWADAAANIRNEASAAVVESLWNIIRPNTNAPESTDIFRILAAGYCLAGKTTVQLPITPEDAQRAYHREVAPRMEPVSFDVTDDNTVHLPAREQPYRLRLDPAKGQSLLAGGSKIVTRRFVAEPNWQGITNTRAMLEIAEDCQDDRRIQLVPGDYININYVDNIPVYVHPFETACGDITLRRRAETLILSAPGQEDTAIDCAGKNIISFAPDTGGGWLLLNDSGLDASQYTSRMMHQNLLWYADEAVEIKTMANGALLFLDAYGHVHSSDSNLVTEAGHPFTSINMALARKGMDEHDA